MAKVTFPDKVAGDQFTAAEVNEIKASVDSLHDNKVEVEAGKGLSTEDYTTAEKTKLAGLVNVSVAQDLGVSTTDVMSQKAVSDIVNMTPTEILPTGETLTKPSGRVVENFTGSSRVNQLQLWGETSIMVTPLSRFSSIKIKAAGTGDIVIGFALVPSTGAATILYQTTKNIPSVGVHTFTAAEIVVPEAIYSYDEVYVVVSNATSTVSAINYTTGSANGSFSVTISSLAVVRASLAFPFSIVTEEYAGSGDLVPLVAKALELEDRLDSLSYAVGKSSANNSTQLAAALLTNDYVEIGNGTHEFASTIALTSGKSIYGMGAATILKPATALNDLITVDTRSGVTIANLTLSGGGAAIDPTLTTTLPTAVGIETYTGKGLKRGIYSTKSTKLIVENVSFTGWNWAGFYHDYPGGSASVDAMLAGVTGSNLYFDNCYAGLLISTRGEFSRFDNLSAIKCIVGASIRAGNVIVANSQFTMGRIGIHIGTGENEAHGAVNSCLVNHNKLRGVYVNGVTSGQSFEGCVMYDSVLEIYNSRGVQWNGGIIAGAIIHEAAASGLNRVQNAVFAAGLYSAGTITNNGATPLSLKNNWFNDGSSSTAINN